MKICKVLFIIGFVLLFLSCTDKNLTYRKALKGYIYDINGNSISKASIKYDSLDHFTRRDILSNNKGYFYFPSVKMNESLKNKERISKLSPYIYVYKEKYTTKKIDINLFDKEGKDTIDLGKIYLEAKK